MNTQSNPYSRNGPAHRCSAPRRNAPFSWLLCLLVFFNGSLWGQGTVVGTVTNSATGAPLEGARVVLNQREVFTDSSRAP
jgi:hypothetical protein